MTLVRVCTCVRLLTDRDLETAAAVHSKYVRGQHSDKVKVQGHTWDVGVNSKEFVTQSLCMCEYVLATHILRGIDYTSVVAELKRANHSRPYSQHQRPGQLLLREE